jgi:hypothetical protein
MKANKIANFSDLEQDLIALLPKDGKKVTTADLVEAYYGSEVPLNARNIVVGRLRMIAAKAVHNAEPWRIAKSNRAGPHPMEFWLEKAAA